MDDRWQFFMRRAEFLEQKLNAAEREVDLLWMEGSETRQDRVLRFRQRLRS
jgi:hypothetical protein